MMDRHILNHRLVRFLVVDFEMLGSSHINLDSYLSFDILTTLFEALEPKLFRSLMVDHDFFGFDIGEDHQKIF